MRLPNTWTSHHRRTDCHLGFGRFFYSLGDRGDVGGIGGHALSPGNTVRWVEGADGVMAVVIQRFNWSGR